LLEQWAIAPQMTVDEVAAIAVFLCSDAARQIIGANISVDGGWTVERPAVDLASQLGTV
jgi:3-hydroxybutyrate dehydrogenase